MMNEKEFECIFKDSYEHVDSNIEYLPESLICSELHPLEYEFCGCSCESECMPDICSCLQRSGAKYDFRNRKDPESYTIVKNLSGKPIYECNNNCKCSGILCGNRLVQCGPRNSLEIIKMDGKGLAMKTNSFIPSGSFICEYAGKIITSDVAKLLYPIYKCKYSMNYLFCINEQFGDAVYKTIIDPTESGNIGRYINHSCECNCELVAIRVHNNFPKLCIFAKEDIEINNEITFNYGDGPFSDNKDVEEGVKCLCGKPSCNKFLPFDGNCF